MGNLCPGRCRREAEETQAFTVASGTEHAPATSKFEAKKLLKAEVEAIMQMQKLPREMRENMIKRKQSIEAAAAAAQKQKSAEVLLTEALFPSRIMDFPCITEICQRLEDHPREMPETVNLLVSVLSEKDMADPRRIMKALTLTNEMVYDDHSLLLRKLAASAAVTSALQDFQELQGDTGLDKQTEETIHILATEIGQRIQRAKELVELERSNPDAYIKYVMTHLDDLNGKSIDCTVESIFQHFDNDGNGTLEGTEYHECVRELAEHMLREYEELMEKRFEKMKDMGMSKEEISIMREEHKSNTRLYGLEAFKKEVIELVDLDGNGTITMEEAKHGFHKAVDKIDDKSY